LIDFLRRDFTGFLKKDDIRESEFFKKGIYMREQKKLIGRLNTFGDFFVHGLIGN